MPASGKTTLARRLAAELRVPCLCKDDVKEALFDELGMTDRDGSRRYSDASFAVLLRLARTLLAAGLPCLLEGNWRPEHASPLSAAAAGAARVAQILCRCAPAERARRFVGRVRHPGHLDALESREEPGQTAAAGFVFLDLPGPCWAYDSDSPSAYAELLDDLKSWRL
jgi:predicted kinase